jgi:hypothetical protein
MANLFGYGSTVKPLMKENFKLFYDDTHMAWVLHGRLEGCIYVYSGTNKDKVIESWTDKVLNNIDSSALEPEWT